jgi:glycosyltransferase involved in cell wall biosynthesis
MTMAKLSVIVLTYNEERNIEECLASVAWADEIIVVDSGSSDKTLERAGRHASQIVTLPWNGYGAARNTALSRTAGEWILWLDADERVTPELAEEIRGCVAANDPEIAGYAVGRRAYFCGKWIRHCGWYPSRVVRLFRKSAGRFSETRVHEQLVISGKIIRCRNDLLHFTDPDLRHYFQKFNSYTTLAAEDMNTAGRVFRVTDVVLRPIYQFTKMYILRLGFLDGMHGFIVCAASSAYVFAKYAKLWELQKKRNAKENRDGNS